MRVAIFILLMIPTILQGQRLRTEGKTIVNSNNDEVILRGVGLGGWMLMEGYMMQSSDVANTQHEFRAKLEDLMGKAKTDDFFDAWLENHVTKKDIDSLAAWGFNSVRLPMHYNLFTLPIEEEPVTGENTWLPKGFELVDSLLSWCKMNSIYLVLDLHAAPGGQGEDAAISDYDSSKPSLWESKENRDKTVALWTKLAERYKNEDWIGGYDLINETNWYKADIGSNNALLKQLSVEISQSIRATGDDHIIIIEGNGWANDFNGMTPPWDDNMAYSFHKYWSYNDTGSIQWVLNLRNEHNVPLWMGEGGENSNPWFTDAISLFEQHNIGWSWWPMKRVETIVSPYSIPFTEGYKNILDYWRGQAPMPSADQAFAWMMELATLSNSDSCDYQKDTHDAMLRQPHTDASLAYNSVHLPGTVFMSDFDLGKHGFAYFDSDYANYSGSTGQFAFWNRGWVYRNDAVDIEKSAVPGGNGYNIGFVKKGEWYNYSVNIDSGGVYTIDLQYASPHSGSKVHLALDKIDVTPIIILPNSGGWSSYQSHQVENVILPAGEHTLNFFIDGDKEANFSKIDLILKSSSIDLPFVALTANTDKSESSLSLTMNYAIDSTSISGVETDFEIGMNGLVIIPSTVRYNKAKASQLELEFDTAFHISDELLISYTGTAIKDTTGQTLQQFADLAVLNELDPRWIIPGKVQAEAYSVMSGFQLEECKDVGGGQNLGFADPGDYADYLIRVREEQMYEINFRIASELFQGSIKVYLLDGVSEIELGNYSYPSTGGWQQWQTSSHKIRLPKGDNTIRLRVTSGGFNLNWFDFSEIVLSIENNDIPQKKLYPNPSNGHIYVANSSSDRFVLRNLTGQLVASGKINDGEIIIPESVRQGNYILSLINSIQTTVEIEKIHISR